MNRQPLPHFLIVGAAKAGTTALHTYFQQHPGIQMTTSKETNFFAYEGQDLNFQGPGDEEINRFSITTLAQYQSEFSASQPEAMLGEACPLYLYEPSAAERIRRYIPQAKIIAILRNPIDRAFANFLHLIRDDREPFTDFGHALAAEQERIESNWEWFWHYSKVGFYGKQLERYYHTFDASQIKIYLYEDFRQDPIAVMADMFTFIGVDPNFCPDMSIRPNKSGAPKNRFMHQLLTKPNLIKTLAKPLFPKRLRQTIQHRNLQTPQLSNALKDQLFALYHDDIKRCETLIQRDLSGWLKGESIAA